jgi:4-amino-4-deoxy-L-arabinose transferase-like glycosyltransferase
VSPPDDNPSEEHAGVASRPAFQTPTRVPLALWLLGAIGLLVFSGPLFLGLDRSDMRNDEAIYSYAVQRILETGDWLTPRNIPNDDTFLEKPPLKFWLVAGAMAAGLTPTDEFGMRIFDAIFGAIGFAYLTAMGWRLAGPFCSAVALLVLFAYPSLIFSHGLRSNNMEAALFLTYCGGLFHVIKWREQAAARARHLHAAVAALYFVLGFMTKFVAAFFLPLTALVWLLTTPGGLKRLVAGWRDWIGPAILAAVLILPWFVYQMIATNGAFWDVIFGQHVYARLTASLDPTHLQPWHFYFTETWSEFVVHEAAIPVVAGLVALVWTAWQGSSLSRLLLAWWLIPYTVMSLGTSKLIHYAYPFVAPLALGAGLAAVMVVRLAYAQATRINWDRFVSRLATRPRARRTLVVLALGGLVFAAWTHFSGQPIRVFIGDVMVFRNGSVLRPFVIALIALVAAGYARHAVAVAAATLVLLVLPVTAYEQTVTRALTWDRPMHAAAACMLRLQEQNAAPRSGVYLSDWRMVAHPPFYYFRHVGPWQTGPEGWFDATVEGMRLGTPAIIGETQWPDVRDALVGSGTELPRIVRLEPQVLLLLPGAYAVCDREILPFGGTPFRSEGVRR